VESVHQRALPKWSAKFGGVELNTSQLGRTAAFGGIENELPTVERAMASGMLLVGVVL